MKRVWLACSLAALPLSGRAERPCAEALPSLAWVLGSLDRLDGAKGLAVLSLAVGLINQPELRPKARRPSP